jgi:hypothetical protein
MINAPSPATGNNRVSRLLHPNLGFGSVRGAQAPAQAHAARNAAHTMVPISSPHVKLSSPQVNFSSPQGKFSSPHGNFSSHHSNFSSPHASHPSTSPKYVLGPTKNTQAQAHAAPATPRRQASYSSSHPSSVYNPPNCAQAQTHAAPYTPRHNAFCSSPHHNISVYSTGQAEQAHRRIDSVTSTSNKTYTPQSTPTHSQARNAQAHVCAASIACSGNEPYAPHSNDVQSPAINLQAHARAASTTSSSKTVHSSQTNSIHSPEEDEQAYTQICSEVNQTLDTTEHSCELCGLRYGGFEMLMHIHFTHGLSYSDACPCDDCIFSKLTGFPVEPLGQGDSMVGSERPIAQSGHGEVVQPTAARDANAAPSIAGEPTVFGGQMAPTAGSKIKVAPAQNMSVLGLLQRTATRPILLPPLAFTTHAAEHNSPPTFKMHAAKHSSPLAGSTKVIRIDSISPMHNPPAAFVALKHIRPATGVTKMVPNKISWHQENPVISERNLPYEVSKLESGELHHDDSGDVFWKEASAKSAPNWRNEFGDVLSKFTQKAMRWFDFLPQEISRDVSGWQLVCWHREAAKQEVQLKHQDLYDRMPGKPLTSSGLTGRVTSWQRGIGMLPQTKVMNFNWPSRHAMDTIAGLSYIQLKLNTWWDVSYVSSRGAYFARQPEEHPGYRDPVAGPRGVRSSTPYYFIENPENYKVSENVKLIDDAMLFLTIKAEECGMQGGYSELLQWFGLKTDDEWIENLGTDLVLEFQRWRNGCPDTPSVDVLRTALSQAGSVAEVEAIKRADYSLTPWLQDVVKGLTPTRSYRRQSEDQLRGRISTKAEKRKNDKRKIEQVEDADEGSRERTRHASEDELQPLFSRALEDQQQHRYEPAPAVQQRRTNKRTIDRVNDVEQRPGESERRASGDELQLLFVRSLEDQKRQDEAVMLVAQKNNNGERTIHPVDDVEQEAYERKRRATEAELEALFSWTPEVQQKQDEVVVEAVQKTNDQPTIEQVEQVEQGAAKSTLQPLSSNELEDPTQAGIATSTEAEMREPVKPHTEQVDDFELQPDDPVHWWVFKVRTMMAAP